MTTEKEVRARRDSRPLLKKGIAEFIGVLVLVMVGCGTIMMTGNIVAAALALGLAVVAMYCAIGNISGCHINPAVSFGKLLARKIGGIEFVVYIIAQILGALVGAFALFSLFRVLGVNPLGWATNTVAFGVTSAWGYIMTLIIESILAFVFVYVFLSVSAKEQDHKMSGLIIGLAFAMIALFGIGVTGASANPARSIGPAVMSAIFRQGLTPLAHSWIFVIAPLIGAAIAAIVFAYLNKRVVARRTRENQG